jgi:uncharacterized protein (DUF433 family)
MATPHQTEPHIADTESYSLLEPHPDNWRKQLWLKGRNMTVGMLVYGMRGNGTLDDLDRASRKFALPVEQIQQALDYYRTHKALVEAEADEEKRWLAEHGFFDAPRR